MVSRLLLAGSLFGAAAVPGVAHAEARKSDVRQVMRDNHLAGSVLMVQNGSVQTVNYGYAWFGRRLENGSAAITYPAASLQKVVTGAMLVQIMNEKKHTSQDFSQYTRISRWYPHLKNASRVTVGNLLTHTSGYRASGSESNRGRQLSENQAISWVTQKINASWQYQQGSYHYNNANYVLLVGIIRKLTGHSYAYNFNRRIVRPLGLKATSLRSSIPWTRSQAVSYAYLWQRKYQRPVSLPKSVASQIPGAGNMCTTPLEYYKMMLSLQDGAVLNQSDYYYLTHLKARRGQYSGGMYLKRGGKVKSAFGAISAEHYATYVQLTSDNRNGIIMFVNERSQTEQQLKGLAFGLLEKIQRQTFSLN
ncbi:serine hydrolase domain-containing protein [Lactobacillus nasalidis]|uniref:serine hydrolase domain-containing protein n=1 Tax=Lactobacillus nasalidis TaxID=2797258 RepID=UPI001FD4B681|nr:serine hydrolase domain-containing protein [Lactobacillus nasalidis]